MLENLGKYNKTIVAVLVFIVGWITLVVNSPESGITTQEWIVGATGLLTALGVYGVENKTV